MDYKVLYRKYRPDDFSNIIGQDYMITILKNSIKKDKISHAYIFSGPRGTGKTSTAKVFAKAINCLNPTEFGPCNECESCLHFKENADIIEMDAASNNGVDEIREIINNIKLAPAYSKYKVYIIDEVHMLSTSAFNALLLTLEEPPKHVVFILATTNIESVPITILSRCQRFDFHKITTEDIINRLKYVTQEEKIEVDDEALEEIAYISDGGMRDALSILDQLSSNVTKITVNDVIAHFGSVSKKQISDLFDCITTNNITKFDDMMKKFKTLAIDYKLLIKKCLEKIEEEAIQSKKDYDYKGLSYTNLKDMAFELAGIANYVNINIDPYLLIEITLLKYFNQNQVSQEKNEEKLTQSKKEELSIPKIISREIISENETKENELINIRINNCFVNPSKEFKQNIMGKWPTIINDVQNKSLMNVLIDCKIAAASDKIAIISTNYKESASLINKQLEELTTVYQKLYGVKYQFIAITEDRWQEEIEKYKINRKNNIKYEYKDEENEKKEPMISENTNDIEKVAMDIFDNNKLEIE